MGDDTIAAKANIVVRLFELILALEQKPRQLSADEDTYGIEDQYGRFNIWAGNIGVFADGHASLDYRLRDSAKADHFMKELLDGLQLLLRQAAQDAGVKQDDQEWQNFESPLEEDNGSDASFSVASSYLSSQGSSYASLAETDNLTPAQGRVKRIEEVIDHLYQLSIVIRKPSTQSRNSKIANTKIVDEEGNDCDSEFVNFASRLVDHRFPSADPSLRARLSRCIVLRRKRFLYNQRHQLKLRYRGSAEKPNLPSRNADADASTVVRIQPSGDVKAAVSRKTTTLVPPSRTSATSFAKSKLEQKVTLGTHSVISRTIAASSDRLTLEPIPPPPKASPGSKEVECPYCCLMIPIKDTLKPNWRKHFLNDLAPFVCMYNTCDDNEHMFSDRRSWVMHMQEKHTRQWCCVAPVHDLQFFDSESAFEHHMWTNHEGAFDESHLPILKKGAERSGQAFTSCPLCGIESQLAEAGASVGESPVMSRARAQAISDEIAKHVAVHLQSIAMFSLPPWSKVEEEDLQSEATAPTQSEGETSHSDDDLGSLHFDSDENLLASEQIESFGSIRRTYSGSETGLVPGDDASALAEWRFIEPISYFGHDRDPTLQPFLRKLYIESSPYMSEGNGPKLPCHLIPFARNNTFFGRELALAEAERVLCPSKSQVDPLGDKIAHSLPRTHAIYGPGGMGKTQVACEFAYRHVNEFDAIFWVHADDKPSLFQDFNYIAIQLGLVPQDTTDARDYTNTRELVKRWLVDPRKDLKDEDSEKASWLLIYDGVDDSMIINDFWPYDGPGSILITSRSPFSWVVSWPLVPFSVDEATDFLLSLTGRKFDSASKNGVAGVNQKLGGLPLALTQMAGLIKQRDMSFPEFVQAYNQRERRQEMLNAKPDESLRPPWYEHNLASVWALEHLSPHAATLLDTFSMFDPDGISERLYKETVGIIDFPGLPSFPHDLSEYKKAKNELLNSSLISGNHMNRKFFVHRIVQDVARMRLSKQQVRETFMACVQLVSHLWPFEVFTSWRHGTERWTACDELFHHVLRLKELSESCVPSDDDFDGDYSFARLLTDAGWYRHERGRSDESNAFNDVAQRICEVWKQRLTAHQDSTEEQTSQLRMLNATVAEIVHNRGCIATEINAPINAFDHFHQFNAMMIQEFKENPELVQEDMRLAISWNELGNAYMLKKKWAKGQECFNHSIDTMKLLRNFQDIDLSLPLVNLGLSYWLQGEYAKALEVLTKGLEDRERMLGVDDRGSFTKGRYLHALGNVKTSMNELEEGLSFHRKALQHYKSTVGSNHHRTADVYVKVAEHFIQLKQEETAMALLDHALRAYSNADIYAPEKARAFFMRSRVLRRLGRDSESEQELEQAAWLYAQVTCVRGRDPESLSNEDFDSIISFWSR